MLTSGRHHRRLIRGDAYARVRDPTVAGRRSAWALSRRVVLTCGGVLLTIEWASP